MWIALALGGAVVAIVIFSMVQSKRLALRAGGSEAKLEQSAEVIDANLRRQEMRTRQRASGNSLVDRLRKRARRGSGA